jgi:hypothetical protein
VFAVAGDLGHIAGVLAGFAAVVFAFGCGAVTGGMGALFHFFGHGTPLRQSCSNLIAITLRIAIGGDLE